MEPLKNSSVPVEILRDGETITTSLKVDEDGYFGIQPGGTLDDLERLEYYSFIKKDYGFFESWVVGGTKFKEQIIGYGQQLKKIFNPKTGAIKGVGGFPVSLPIPQR